MTKTLYILRGLPGTGKSTLAQLMRGCVAIAADEYFRFQSFQSLLPWLLSGFPKPVKVQDSKKKLPGSTSI